MDMKPSNEILGFLTERYLRFKEADARRTADGINPAMRLSDFDCGRMHQIVCTIAAMTGSSVKETRATLDKLFEKGRQA